MEIGASPSQIFGSPGPDQLFTGTSTAVATDEQETARITIKAQRREINRIHGYKLELTPNETRKLAELQSEIVEIGRKISAGTVREDELEDRTAKLKEADEIIGKPTIDVEADEFLAELAGGVETLLQPKLSPVELRRVEQLERVKDTIEQSFNANPESDTLRRQFINISQQIETLTPPRAISQLSKAEKAAYDDLAELINDHAGAKIQLPARDAIRVAELERSISQLQELAPPDPAGQPTPQAVSRAYARLL